MHIDIIRIKKNNGNGCKDKMRRETKRNEKRENYRNPSAKRDLIDRPFPPFDKFSVAHFKPFPV